MVILTLLLFAVCCGRYHPRKDIGGSVVVGWREVPRLTSNRLSHKRRMDKVAVNNAVGCLFIATTDEVLSGAYLAGNRSWAAR